MKSLVLIVLCAACLCAASPSGFFGGHAGGIFISGPSGVVTDYGAFGPSGPRGFGNGIFSGFGGFGGYGGLGGYGGHGVVVRGPSVVPATIIGPAGKIVTDDIYGGHGYGW